MNHWVQLREAFEAANQGHVFRHYRRLREDEQLKLLAQAQKIDLEELHYWSQKLIFNPEKVSHEGQIIEPAPYIALPANDRDFKDRAEAKEIGESILREGKVALLTVAGGQGTRLGYDGPKGMFPITPIQGKSLFQVFAEKIKIAEERHDRSIHWFIMTSELNYDETVSFFKKYDFFHLKQVHFFKQRTIPVLDVQGRILMESPGSIAMSPDGHGGALSGLCESGAIDLMKGEGIEILASFQVDNPLLPCVDPVFFGFHIRNQSELSSKMVKKRSPDERVGIFCWVNKQLKLVEYSDLPRSIGEVYDEKGALRHVAGSIAVHILDRELIRRIGCRYSREFILPYHRANKKVKALAIDDPDSTVPIEQDGVKFESFLFDAIRFAKNPIVFEVAREDEFSPVKNATGNDSPETSRRDQVRQFLHWLQSAGLDVPKTAKADSDKSRDEMAIEISPLFADNQEIFSKKSSAFKDKWIFKNNLYWSSTGPL